MSTQAKSKLYLLIIGILLATNIAMLYFCFGDKPGGKKPKGPDRSAMMREFLKKDIGFDTTQIQLYDTLSKKFKQKSKTDFDSLKNNKEQQFKELGTKAFNDSAIAAMAERSAEKQKLMELQMLNHFASIRKLGTAEQQVKFDSLFYKIWSKKKKPEEKK
jgi:arsenate reductase-like glutaredoxin family protein